VLSAVIALFPNASERSGFAVDNAIDRIEEVPRPLGLSLDV
jgi:hypothetical protein